MRMGVRRKVVIPAPPADDAPAGLAPFHFQDLGAWRAWRRARAGLLGAAWLNRLRRAQSLTPREAW